MENVKLNPKIFLKKQKKKRHRLLCAASLHKIWRLIQ
nr:MAG TPA: hypothetical protein [Caudoviricetes sp.]